MSTEKSISSQVWLGTLLSQWKGGRRRIRLGFDLGARRHGSLSMWPAQFTRKLGCRQEPGWLWLPVNIIPCMIISGTSQRKMATSYGEILEFLSPEYILSHNSVQCYPHFKHIHHPEELFLLWRIVLKSVWRRPIKSKKTVNINNLAMMPHNLWKIVYSWVIKSPQFFEKDEVGSNQIGSSLFFHLN